MNEAPREPARRCANATNNTVLLATNKKEKQMTGESIECDGIPKQVQEQRQ